MIAAGATGLLALAWAGGSRIERTSADVEVRAGDPSLTEHFSAMLATAEHRASRTASSTAPILSARIATPPSVPARLQPQAISPEARPATSLLGLQTFRRATSIAIRGPRGRQGTAVLTDLNPRINDGYLLELAWSHGVGVRLHLENARPDLHRLVLDPAFPSGLVVTGSGDARACDLWSDRVPGLMREVAQRRRPYTELCGGDVLVRHRTRGSRTSREWATDFLRSNVPGGEALTVLVKNTVYPDAFLEEAEVAAGTPDASAPPDGPGFPPPALVSPESRSDRIVSRELGISVPAGGAMVAGRWYPASAAPGVFVSLMTAGRAARDVLGTSPVRTLDAVESGALVYLVAFDLEGLDLGFGLGTDHPGVGWSERVPASVRSPVRPGPDGFDDLLPLESTGFVPPQIADRVVATFAGGFKRAHGAFRTGALSRVNSGSHYGFVEGGVVLSRLHPGLSTLFALDDGSVAMKTWARSDDALLERVRSARQNGVPLLERNPQTGEIVPGPLVGRWGEGNWGGSQDARLRSVRAGAGLLASNGRRYLVFAYFSSATPSAMAVVLASYGCHYAMHLDMNAPEHTYLALYRTREGRLDVEHLVRAMSVLDKTSGGTTVPRFLAVADNRDFFYLSRRRVATPGGPVRAAGTGSSSATRASP
ncbi:MAG: hypothetical protein ACYDBY_14115 [Thermoanaerobaculia bacterium]